MSREIKFRAWDKREKRMIDAYEFDGLYSYTESAELSFWLDNPGTELMQFTGLKDKNGVEIYEGDILSVSSGSSIDKENVEWVEEMAGFAPFVYQIPSAADSYSEWMYRYDGYEIEVIGNIYENPELLKEP